MKFWKVLIVFVLPYFILGCCKCAKYLTVTQYSHCAIALDNLDSLSSKLNDVSTADTIDVNQYGIRVHIERSKDLCQAPINIFNTAYACKCPEPHKHVPTDSAIRFTITTINNFDNTHLAGDTMNSYFRHFNDSSYSPIHQGVLNYFSQDYGAWGPDLYPISFDIALINPPSVAGKHSFVIEIQLSDNRLITATSKEVYLK